MLAALPNARLVGGAVRDCLAGIAPGDIDLATPDPPDAVTARLQAAGLRAIPTGLAHGTITAIAQGHGFEITTLRRDILTDGRHAVVAWTDDWREDAARRDFTINAMSATPDGTVHDYFGGIADLQAGILRFVGDPSLRIAEDALRILRFFRFYARFGATPPTADTTAAITSAAATLNTLSVERVWSELRALLASQSPLAAITLMQRLGVLDTLLPQAYSRQTLADLLAKPAPADPILRLAALFTGNDTNLAERLKFSRAEADRLHALRTTPTPTPGMSDADLRRLLAGFTKDIVIGSAWLAAADATTSVALATRIAATKTPIFPLAGRDALALGAAPGPAIGAVLAQVRAWWLAAGCTADAHGCRAYLAHILQRTG